jgi:succinate-acetate transporter protein
MATEHKTTSELMENDRARIFLQPIASPWVLGLFGFSIAAFVTGGQYAGWFSGAGASAMIYVAFAALLGGFAQMLSAMWAFKARDVLSTAFNGIWGTFWLAIGFLNLIVSQTATAAATMPAAPIATHIGSLEMGFFYIPMALITAACAAASMYHSRALVSSLVVLTGASVLMAIGLLAGSTGIQIVGGWLLVISTAFAWYSATVSLIATSYAKARMPVRLEKGQDLNEGLGEPGVVHDIGAKTPGFTVLRKAGAQAR